MVDVRHQFGDDYMLLDAPLRSAERSLDPITGTCPRHCGIPVVAAVVGAVDAACAAASLRVITESDRPNTQTIIQDDTRSSP
ncbi:hypothetical protein [Plantactinospora alkalitolerans]|uniref:hypothetical protein n=1 Tax=Plantactinospora alkalitolerans TaxID=2789879 RepID=UPI001E579420|nr:hypothetical protein [Plantactinospora alkalitolerans]